MSWGLITGFNSPFPWFYSVFFTVMIIHRARRDLERCRERYGEAWEEYERRVPYLFIPVSSPTCGMKAEADEWLSTYSELIATILIGRLGKTTMLEFEGRNFGEEFQSCISLK